MSGRTRRRFLRECASAAAGVCVTPGLARAANSAPSVHFPTDPRKRVTVAAYPFREFLVGWKGWDGKTPSRVPAAQQVELIDFAAHIAGKFGVHNIEPWSPVFPSTDAKYLDRFRESVEKAGSAVVDVAVDAGHSPYAANDGEREQSVAAIRRWTDVGAALGSPSIRAHINRARDSKPDVSRAAETLGRAADYAATKNVVVHLENDDPVSEDPFFIAAIIDKVGSPWLRALPDFGNSLAAHDEAFQDRAMEAMFARAYGICHVKDGEVDDEGRASHVDLAKTFAVLKEHNYKGYCSIEYDEPGDPYAATAKLVEETVRYLS